MQADCENRDLDLIIRLTWQEWYSLENRLRRLNDTGIESQLIRLVSKALKRGYVQGEKDVR
jgi:hypothetical protein